MIAAVATDMNAGYISTVTESLPEAAAIIFDRFHGVKLIHAKVTQIRRQTFRELTSPLERKAVKGTNNKIKTLNSKHTATGIRSSSSSDSWEFMKRSTL